MKAQPIRLLDVFFIGPLMIWGGLSLAKKHPRRGGALAAIGGATMLYNGNNYLKLRAQKEEKASAEESTAGGSRPPAAQGTS